MSYPAWPGTLPQVFEEGSYQEALTDNTIRTKMDVGPDKVRRRSTAVVEKIRGTMTLDQTQWGTLRTFYYTTLASSLPYTWIHPSTGAAINCRFVSPPSVSGRSPYVSVNLDIEVIP